MNVWFGDKRVVNLCKSTQLQALKLCTMRNKICPNHFVEKRAEKESVGMEPEISGGNLAALSHVCFLLLSPYGNDRG